MNAELRKRLEEAEKKYHYCSQDKIFSDGVKFGYKEAIEQAKKWIIEHTGCDVECNENGEPLADSYIKGRKLAIKIAAIFEADMNELWEE